MAPPLKHWFRDPRRKDVAKKKAMKKRAKKSAKKKSTKKSAKKKSAARRPKRAARASKRPVAAAPPKNPPGTITHTELASSDPGATKSWCASVLGWKFGDSTPTPTGPYHMWRFPNGT